MRECWFHNWELVKDTGAVKYAECTKCKKRRTVCDLTNGYSPIDHEWLETGEWSNDLEHPPHGGSGVPKLDENSEVKLYTVGGKILEGANRNDNFEGDVLAKSKDEAVEKLHNVINKTYSHMGTYVIEYVEECKDGVNYLGIM